MNSSVIQNEWKGFLYFITSFSLVAFMCDITDVSTVRPLLFVMLPWLMVEVTYLGRYGDDCVSSGYSFGNTAMIGKCTTLGIDHCIEGLLGLLKLFMSYSELS
jgi:hypothetical protein